MSKFLELVCWQIAALVFHFNTMPVLQTLRPVVESILSKVTLVTFSMTLLCSSLFKEEEVL